MSGRDEPSETRKRRRRRSLRVPVDEVPRPTSARGIDDPPFDPAFDGGRTLEIPAYTDEVEEGRTTLDEPLDALDPALLGAMRAPGPEEPLEEAPTVVREAPSEADEAASSLPLASVEIQLDEHGPNTLVGDDAPEHALDEDELEEDEPADDGGDRPTPVRHLSVPAPAPVDEPTAEAPDEVEEKKQEAPAAVAIRPVVQVIVQRVVAVASASTTPPPPEEDDEPHASFDFDEPDITVDDSDHADDGDGADDLEELDVDLDGDEADARARAEEIS